MRWRCSREIRLVPAGSSLVVVAARRRSRASASSTPAVQSASSSPGLLLGTATRAPARLPLGAPALSLEARGLALLLGALRRVAHVAASGTVASRQPSLEQVGRGARILARLAAGPLRQPRREPLVVELDGDRQPALERRRELARLGRLSGVRARQRQRQSDHHAARRRARPRARADARAHAGIGAAAPARSASRARRSDRSPRSHSARCRSRARAPA